MVVVVNDRVKRRNGMCESEGGCGSQNKPRGRVVVVIMVVDAKKGRNIMCKSKE